MGSCASVHRSSDSATKFDIPSKPGKHLVSSSTVKEKPSANDVDAPINSNSLVHNKSQVSPMDSSSSFGGFGSKEETFFDAQPYLDSDCDEDFYSVNGDFAPSRGSSLVETPQSQTISPRVNNALSKGPVTPSRESTPIHISISTVPSQGNAAHLKGKTTLTTTSTNSPSSIGKRKKLGDLFRDSSKVYRQDEQHGNHSEVQKNHHVSSLTKSADATLYISSPTSLASSGEVTPIELLDKKAKKEKKPLKSGRCCFPRLASTCSLKKTMMPSSVIVVDA